MHRIQRIPKGSAKRHTSDVSLIVVPMTSRGDSLADADAWDSEALGEVREEFYRGSGRGGQRRNKVSTAVRLVHVDSGIEVRQESGRRQVDNRRAVRERLLGKLAEVQEAANAEMYRGERRELLDSRSRVLTHNEQRSTVKISGGDSNGVSWAWRRFYAGEWE